MVGIAFVVVASLERLVIHSRSFLGAEDVAWPWLSRLYRRIRLRLEHSGILSPGAFSRSVAISYHLLRGGIHRWRNVSEPEWER